jgi:membrane protease YdiL (CAAX protease family)
LKKRFGKNYNHTQTNSNQKGDSLNSNILRSLLLFVSTTILIQVFYAVQTNTNLFQGTQYFPAGYTIHILYYLSIMAVLFLFLGKISLEPVGLKRVPGIKKYVLIGLVFALIGFALRILFIQGTFGNSIYPMPYYVFVPAFVFLGLLIGLVEESVFRGYILKNFLEKNKPLFAILLSCFLFGIYHVNYIGLNFYNSFFWTLYVIQAFTGGIIMALLFFKTHGNLVGSIAYHSTNIVSGQVFLWMPNVTTTYVLEVETIINLVLVLVLHFLPIGVQKK